MLGLIGLARFGELMDPLLHVADVSLKLIAAALPLALPLALRPVATLALLQVLAELVF